MFHDRFSRHDVHLSARSEFPLHQTTAMIMPTVSENAARAVAPLIAQPLRIGCPTRTDCAVAPGNVVGNGFFRATAPHEARGGKASFLNSYSSHDRHGGSGTVATSPATLGDPKVARGPARNLRQPRAGTGGNGCGPGPHRARADRTLRKMWRRHRQAAAPRASG